MATAKSSSNIYAPVEKVFEYVQPETLLEIWPSFVEVKNVKELSNGGYSWEWVDKMAGMRFNGASEDTCQRQLEMGMARCLKYKSYPESPLPGMEDRILARANASNFI